MWSVSEGPGNGEGAGETGAFYMPQAQRPARRLTFTVRTTGAPTSVATSVRREIARVDREMPVYDVKTMAERARQSLATRRSPMLLALGFGLLALFLSAIGIYGVLAYLGPSAQRRSATASRWAAPRLVSFTWSCAKRRFSSRVAFAGARRGGADSKPRRAALRRAPDGSTRPVIGHRDSRDRRAGGLCATGAPRDAIDPVLALS